MKAADFVSANGGKACFFFSFATAFMKGRAFASVSFEGLAFM